MRHLAAAPLSLALALSTAVVLGASAPAAAQTPAEIAALRKDVDALKAGQAALQKQLDEIKAMLRPAPQDPIINVTQDVSVPIADSPVRGAASAGVVLVEFSDYECPFCGRFANDALPQIDRDYIQTGKIRHVFRDFPLESIHKNAFKASEAAACAGQQGKYWQMHMQLFANQKALTPPDLVRHAQSVGLDAAAFQQCLNFGKMAARVRQDVELGQKMGISGTPMILIGRPAANGEVKIRKVISGAMPFSVFKQAIDDVLAGK